MDITKILIATIEPFFGLLSLVVSGYIAYITLILNKKSDAAKEVTDATHTLVNSNMGIQLKIAQRLAEKVAKLTRKKEDIEDAKQTKKLYEEHMAKQAIVDKARDE